MLAHAQVSRPLLLNLISKPPLQYAESVNVIGIRTVAHRWHCEELFVLESHQFLYFFCLSFSLSRYNVNRMFYKATS